MTTRDEIEAFIAQTLALIRVSSPAASIEDLTTDADRRDGRVRFLFRGLRAPDRIELRTDAIAELSGEQPGAPGPGA